MSVKILTLQRSLRFIDLDAPDVVDERTPRRRFLATALATTLPLAGRTEVSAAGDTVVAMTGGIKTDSGEALLRGVLAAIGEANSAGRASHAIRLVALDDGDDPVRARGNAQVLMAQRPACFVAATSQNVAEAISPLLSSAQVPLIGVRSGSESLRAEGHQWLFHARASRSDEAFSLVSQFDALGLSRVAVVYADNEFGRDAVSGVQTALGYPPKVAIKVSPSLAQLVDPQRELTQRQPECVVAAISAVQLSDLLKRMRGSGFAARVAAISEVELDRVIALLGAEARGVGFAQVFPSPYRTSIPLVRDFQRALAAAGAGQPSYACLEGYVYGRLVVEALVRAKGRPTIAGLENSRFDLNGFVVSYPAGKRRGSQFVEQVVLDAEGRVRV